MLLIYRTSTIEYRLTWVILVNYKFVLCVLCKLWLWMFNCWVGLVCVLGVRGYFCFEKRPRNLRYTNRRNKGLISVDCYICLVTVLKFILHFTYVKHLIVGTLMFQLSDVLFQVSDVFTESYVTVMVSASFFHFWKPSVTHFWKSHAIGIQIFSPIFLLSHAGSF